MTDIGVKQTSRVRVAAARAQVGFTAALFGIALKSPKRGGNYLASRLTEGAAWVV